MSTMQIKKVCATCSSDAISYGAFAVWDVVSQAFDLWDFDPTDDATQPWCADCDAFVKTEDQPLE